MKKKSVHPQRICNQAIELLRYRGVPDSQSKFELKAVTALPYIEATTEEIRRTGSTKFPAKPPTKIGQSAKNLKNKKPSLHMPGVHTIICFCGKVYLQDIGRSIQQQIKEHESDVKQLKILKTPIKMTLVYCFI